MTLETFRAALAAAAAQTGNDVFTKALEATEGLGHFTYHCLVNGLRDLE